MKTRIEQIEELIIPALKDLEIALVDLAYFSRGNKDVLDIRLEKLDQKPVTIGECGKASREISALLEVEEVLPNAFILEVGSAGLDRRLKKIEDFTRFIGKKAKVETTEIISERKRFRGIIEKVENEIITIKMEEEGAYEIPFSKIEKARLVI